MTVVLIGTALLLSVYMVVNILYKRTNHYRNPDRDLENYRQGVPCGIRLANFGTTNSFYAFCAHNILGVKSFNFALNCESVEFDVDILKHYAVHLTKGCVVILHLNFCVSMYRCNKLNESRKAWDVIPHGGQIKTSLRQRLAHLLPVAPWQCKKALRLLIDVESNETEAYKYVSASQSAKNAKEMAVCWINLFGLQSLQTGEIGEANQREVEFNTFKVVEFVDFCCKQGFLPVVACTPLGCDLNSYVSDAFGDATLGGIERKMKERGVPFLNYRKDERFQSELSLFTDGGYKLSRRGSLKYMKILLADVQSFYETVINNKSLNA